MKIEAWGLGIWKLARKANDGRIWPEAMKGQEKVLWPKGHRTPKWANWPEQIWCGQLVPTWFQAGLPQHPWWRVITHGCDSLASKLHGNQLQG
ncbi:hypothetical protein O181_009421 [Austropuccinia psidii MF-1]|uniref:Uncharacterized protein n=1 Tax=Austropuccinia psidii MF-1 TaxID=1389203 RepID=A0A9Q3GJG9_9BASI|nr:hypothetical protein [Austropuccinia psidii MF-1]